MYDSPLYNNIASGSLRLVSKNELSAPNLTAGRVEVFYAGQWGTICIDGLSKDDSIVLCSILTYRAGPFYSGTSLSLNLYVIL